MQFISCIITGPPTAYTQYWGARLVTVAGVCNTPVLHGVAYALTRG